jgi:hypothetical protein
MMQKVRWSGMGPPYSTQTTLSSESAAQVEPKSSPSRDYVQDHSYFGAIIVPVFLQLQVPPVYMQPISPPSPSVHVLPAVGSAGGHGGGGVKHSQSMPPMKPPPHRHVVVP